MQYISKSAHTYYLSQQCVREHQYWYNINLVSHYEGMLYFKQRYAKILHINKDWISKSKNKVM